MHDTDEAPRTKRQRIAAALACGIQEGIWPPGTCLPTEARLVETYGVSRQTARHALSDLAAKGLIRSVQGLGTIVLRQQPTPEYAQTLETIGELVRYARETSEKLIGIEELALDATLAREIGVTPGQRWCHAQTLRTAAGHRAPMALSSIWLPARHRACLNAAQASRMPVFLETQRLTGRMVSKVRQSFSATMPDRAQCRLLQCGAGEPLLRIRRWYLLADDAVAEMTDTVHPPGRFEFSMTLRHATASAGFV